MLNCPSFTLYKGLQAALRTKPETLIKMAAKPLMALPFTRFSKSFTFLCPFNHKNFPVLDHACCILGWQPCEAGAFPPLDLGAWSFPSYLSTKVIFPELLPELPVPAHRPRPDGGPSNKCSFIPLPLLIMAEIGLCCCSLGH